MKKRTNNSLPAPSPLPSQQTSNQENTPKSYPTTTLSLPHVQSGYSACMWPCASILMSLLPVYLIVAAQQGYPFGTMWERPDSDVGRSGCGCGASASGSGGGEVWGIAYEYALFVTPWSGLSTFMKLIMAMMWAKMGSLRDVLCMCLVVAGKKCVLFLKPHTKRWRFSFGSVRAK